MGDRNIIGFASNKGAAPTYLYSHWGGSDRFNDLADAIEKARPRWDDPSYATRIAICSIIGGKNWDDEVGFGITNDFDELDSNYDDMLVVCWEERVVQTRELRSTRVIYEFSFEEFLDQFMSLGAFIEALQENS